MNLPVLLIVLPLFTAFALGIVSIVNKDSIKYTVIISASIHTYFMIKVLLEVLEGPIVYNLGGWNSFIGIVLVIDYLSIIMGLLILSLTYLALIYSFKYIKKHELKYYVLSLILLSGMLGMVFTGDFFNLYVFFEIVSICSYALVAIKDKKESFEAAFKYLIIGSLGGIFVLLGIIFIYQSTGNLNFAHVANNFAEVPTMVKQSTFILFFIGFGIKFALVPLHTWLPDAHPTAPAPISALLSGVVIKTSIYAFFRILYTVFTFESIIALNLQNLLIYSGVMTLLVGNIIAFKQKNLKRMLAYSTISQVGYIVIALSLGSAQGIVGGIFHSINHALAKGTLFLSAGLFIHYTGKDNIEDFKGLARLFPKVSLAFIFAAFSIMGVPPFGGFASKLLILQGVLDKDYFFVAFVIILGSLLALSYYLKVIIALYSTEDESDTEVIKAPFLMRAPIIILGGSTLVFGIIPQFPLALITKSTELLLHNIKYINLVLGG